MPVTHLGAEPAGTTGSPSASSASSRGASASTSGTTTLRISGPRAPSRRSSSSRGGSRNTSVLTTKNITTAVTMPMVSTKATGLIDMGPRARAGAAAHTSIQGPNPESKSTSSTLNTPTRHLHADASTSSSPVPPGLPSHASSKDHVGTSSSHHKSHSQHRISKPSGSIGSRKVFAKIGSMEPPVQSFYGAEPIPLPTRFANIKRRLIQGKEAAIEASWRRLLVALKDEIAHIQCSGTNVIPTIDFSHIDDPAEVATFGRDLKRYGVAVVRGVVSQTQTEAWIRQTREYIIRNRDHIKAPMPQDPTCFDLFWTPAQIAIRAHPSVLRVQKWAMTFWETKGIDADMSRVATRFPISYADRLRIHDGTITGMHVGSTGTAGNATPQALNGNSSADSLTASAGSTLIAQVDNGSLERWEPDGYGRGGAYEAIFRGDWEAFDPWDPSGRINVTQDLYNGAGACSIFRMFQGILALTSGEPASIRVLPSPKLVVAYFLLRPFFSSRTRPPTAGYDEDGASPEVAAEWGRFLDADNWTLDAEQSTIIHGAVPGHAQRITELWHPHLRLRRSLVEIPTLQAGDYVIWHCDQSYNIMTTAASKPGTPGPETPAPSMLMYTPACPLTQTNALFLARQRKALMLGQPGPDFDSVASALGSEAPHEGRPGKEEIAAVGGDAGLRAMGLAPWELSSDGRKVMTTPGTRACTPTPTPTPTPKPTLTPAPAPAESLSSSGDRMDVDGGAGAAAGEGGEDEEEEEEEAGAEAEAKAQEAGAENRKGSGTSSGTEGEAEVVRLANIILFPDRYDFYIPTGRAEAASRAGVNGRAQAEQMVATRQLISRILS